MIRSAWRSYEYQNQPRCYVGFRCVRSMVFDKTGNNGKTKTAAAASARKTRK